jgi:hypothetical protein
MPSNINWKKQTYIIGGFVGLVVGILAALIIVQRSEKDEIQPRINAGDGVKIGIGVLGVLRLITEMISRR